MEPLQSQAYRKAKEAAEVAAGPPVNQSAHAISTSTDNLDEATTKRRRQNRGPKSVSNAVSSRSSGIQQHTNSVGEPMTFQASFRGGSSELASTPGSTHQSSPQGLESTADVPVKYTRVTHRISKAKKGVRIHTCDICNPPKASSSHEAGRLRY